jgi:hypothetical protein
MYAVPNDFSIHFDLWGMLWTDFVRWSVPRESATLESAADLDR